MAAGSTTQDRVVNAIVDRLRDQIPQFSESTCYVTDEPGAVISPSADVFCTVSITDGVFNSLFIGGGEEQVSEEAGIVVAVYSTNQLDQIDRAHAALLGDERGLIKHFKLEILRALCKGSEWEPTYNGENILRDQLAPARCTRPTLVQNVSQKMLELTITFLTHFDWDLS